MGWLILWHLSASTPLHLCPPPPRAWQIHIVFAGPACSNIRNEAQGVLQRLASAAKEAFNNFEKAVESESSERVPPDGNRHELTSYVVNYIKYLYE